MPKNTPFLLPGETLQPGDSLISANQVWIRTYQHDANFVTYDRRQPPKFGPIGIDLAEYRAHGATGPGRVQMQADGNMVILDAAGVPYSTSLTAGHPGTYMVLGDDGRFTPVGALGADWAGDPDFQ